MDITGAHSSFTSGLKQWLQKGVGLGVGERGVDFGAGPETVHAAWEDSWLGDQPGQELGNSGS